MSSILKALKKLEQETAAARHEPLRIDAEILRTAPANRISPTAIALAAALLFVCGGTVTYIYMSGNRHAPPPPQRAMSPRSSVAEVPRPPALSPATVALPYSARLDRNAASAPLRGPFTPRSRPSGQQLHTTAGDSEGNTRYSATEKPLAASHADSTPPVPTLRVDGIAFQDGAEGVAVVNGVPVSKGSSIEGVRVDEVQRDRVLFSHGGRKIEVLMGTSTR
ncbi:hypothetical protein [Pelobacter propionicus]|uniref:Uncharacterized protein n=1 Tax=Pelobacter propionicus (strain DSM 2379 / NBRC 103807 / OttBd1) TaxID=338966 RepID=A1APV9_PELPD|nr:hypothetical protein [Pelobacter propionicus]ABK99379.1 conserved hypothetical protein [Pelobacter propionicus DSM 2379]